MSSTQPWRLSACPTTDRRGSSAARSPERSRTPATRRRRAHQFVVGDAPSTKRDEARPCGIEDVSFAVGHGRFSLVPRQFAEALDQAGGQLTLLRASVGRNLRSQRRDRRGPTH